MKKVLSLLLAVVMIFSCFGGVVNAAYFEKEGTVVDEQGISQPGLVYNPYEYKNEVYASGDEYIESLINDNVEVLGVSVDYLYNNRGSIFFWDRVTAYTEKEEDDIGKADISVAIGNVNMYLSRIFKALYSDFRLYSNKSAIKLINLLGNLFNPSFPNLKSDYEVFTHDDYLYTDSKTGLSYTDDETFFTKVADLSGLSALIQKNWIENESNTSYRNVISLFNLHENSLLPSEYYRGDRIACVILETIFTKVYAEGPITYFVEILQRLSKAYLTHYYESIVDLFAMKISAGYTSEEELKSLTGLFNLMFNDNGNVKDGNPRLYFAPLPEARLTLAADETEYYLYLMIYLNINAHYTQRNEDGRVGDNGAFFSELIESIRTNPDLVNNRQDPGGNVVASDKDRLIKLVNYFFDLNGAHIEQLFADDLVAGLTTENLNNKFEEYKDNIKEALERLLKRIADWFEMWMKIFNGEIDFGEGAFGKKY